jgi:hypothetical protein
MCLLYLVQKSHPLAKITVSTSYYRTLLNFPTYIHQSYPLFPPYFVWNTSLNQYNYVPPCSLKYIVSGTTDRQRKRSGRTKLTQVFLHMYPPIMSFIASLIFSALNTMENAKYGTSVHESACLSIAYRTSRTSIR